MAQSSADLITLRQQIRVISLALIQDGDRLFVGEGFDAVKQDFFYRALGGGVEFGETSLEGLQREFREELNAELSNLYYLGCLENLFVFNGKPGHELIQLYRADFADRQFYQADSLIGKETNGTFKALWVAIDRFKSGQLRLVPEAFLTFL
ncbi:NUDIX domain-containing protein [Phormidium tenue FACHB-886]|nr:NUDIX domain-containing protein [Phormidium tenue FACHB-886]